MSHPDPARRGVDSTHLIYWVFYDVLPAPIDPFFARAAILVGRARLDLPHPFVSSLTGAIAESVSIKRRSFAPRGERHMILTDPRRRNERARRNDVTVRWSALAGVLACGLTACTNGGRPLAARGGAGGTGPGA